MSNTEKETKTMTTKTLTLDEVLAEIANLGQRRAKVAKHLRMRCEMTRAAYEDKRVQALRDVYRRVRRGEDITTVLEQGKRAFGGVEGNTLNLILIAATTGFSEKHGWTVKDGQIVSRRSVR
jgi:hypothetical protein